MAESSGEDLTPEEQAQLVPASDDGFEDDPVDLETPAAEMPAQVEIIAERSLRGSGCLAFLLALLVVVAALLIYMSAK